MVALIRSLVRTAAFLTLVIGQLTALAQEDRAQPLRAQELWSSVGIQGRLPELFEDLLGKDTYKRFRLAGELGYRSADTFFAGRQVYTDLSARYKVNKHLNFVGEHRFAFRPDGPTRQRTGVMANLGTSWQRFDLGYRFNYQHNYRDFGEQREILRNKVSVEYNIRKFKLDPEVSVEFFTWLGHQGARYIGTRYSIGTEWNPSKPHSIGLKLVHDREYGVAWPTYRWIYSLSYTLNLRDI
ncbi:MAG: DUF2490 domain-containing protein [Flavobacteriales bacterium]|nr:DUF2490 domain-containing protein [Flavobacteriales bacterium]